MLNADNAGSWLPWVITGCALIVVSLLAYIWHRLMTDLHMDADDIHASEEQKAVPRDRRGGKA